MSSRGGYSNKGDQEKLLEGGSHQFHHNHDQHKHSFSPNVLRMILLFAFFALSCLFLYHSAYPIQYVFSISYNALPLSNDSTQESNSSPSKISKTQENLSSHKKLSSPNHSKASIVSNVYDSTGENSSALSLDSTQGKQSVPSANNMQGNSSALSLDSTQGKQSVPSANNMQGNSTALSLDSTQGKQSVPSANNMQGNPSSPSSQSSKGPSDSLGSEGSKKLKKILRKATMADNTVILTTLNAAWAAPNSLFDLFLEGFRNGNQTEHFLNHLIVVALDQTAYYRCKALHLNCYALTTKGADFSGEALYMTDTYLKMMWRRIDFLRIVLEMGYNFIFTDVDILWFRNPFLNFYEDADFQIACDHYLYNATDLNNELNGGFNFVKSNNRTIQFYKFLYTSKDRFPGRHDQDVLNIIKFEPFTKEIGIRIKFLKTAYYGGFCEPSKNLNLVCTMHANCCIGVDSKVRGLRMLLDDWKRYMALPSSERTSKPMTWTSH